MEHRIKIKSIGHVTHDVLRIVTEKPSSLQYTPGQAADIAIGKDRWQTEKRPFTFTSLPADDYLEFTIKVYASRQGVTNELQTLTKGDELILFEVFGAIAYKATGTFIAGGAGITPFISIFRDLRAKNQIGDNKLLFANKTRADIIHEPEFKSMLGKNFLNLLSDETAEGYARGLITVDLLKSVLLPNRNVYVCGPPPMMDAVEQQLAALDVDKSLIVTEAF